MDKAISNLYWHDGQIHSLLVERSEDGSYQIDLKVSIYENPAAPERIVLCIKFQNVKSHCTSWNCHDLKKHHLFGNIVDVTIHKMNKTSKILVLLVDGYVDIEYQFSSLVFCNSI